MLPHYFLLTIYVLLSTVLLPAFLLALCYYLLFIALFFTIAAQLYAALLQPYLLP